jgi:hypothetical protein
MKKVVMFRSGRQINVVDVSGEDSVYVLALRVVKERFGFGLYQEPTEPEQPGFTTGQLKKLGEFPKIVELGKSILFEYNSKKKTYDLFKEEYDSVTKAIEEENGVQALRILSMYNKREGHQFDVFDVSEEYIT